jgi:hypothetical protein
MAIVVSLSKVVDELEIQNDQMTSFLDKDTGEFYTVTAEDSSVIEGEEEVNWDDLPDWQRKYLQETKAAFDKDEMIQLPTQWDIHEYQIMEDFCNSLSDDRISNDLLDAIRGSGAFRRFKDEIYRLRIEADWYAFRKQAFKEIAIGWLEENEIDYKRE